MSLCSFGNSQKLTKCHLFEKVAFAFGKEKCFSFNGSTSSSEHHQRKVGPNNGLNFLVSFRIPSQRQKGPKMQKNLTPLKLIVHEPGTFPDVHHTTNSYHEIKPGYHYIFGTESTSLEVTKSFQEVDEQKRKCELDQTYHFSNCYFQSLIQHGIEQCQCVPWYMKNHQSKICLGKQFLCFEDLMSNWTLQSSTMKKCPPSCSYYIYESSVTREQKLEADYDATKDDIISYFLEESRIYGLLQQSFIQINFANPHATVISQDAKVTFADQLGSIGGTFGVFLGLSFVSLLDEFIGMAQFLVEKFQELYQLYQAKSCAAKSNENKQ